MRRGRWPLPGSASGGGARRVCDTETEDLCEGDEAILADDEPGLWLVAVLVAVGVVEVEASVRRQRLFRLILGQLALSSLPPLTRAHVVGSHERDVDESGAAVLFPVLLLCHARDELLQDPRFLRRLSLCQVLPPERPRTHAPRTHLDSVRYSYFASVTDTRGLVGEAFHSIRGKGAQRCLDSCRAFRPYP